MGHALRGAVTAWLSLIVLQTVSTEAGSGRVAGLFATSTAWCCARCPPTSPAIPDRSAAGGAAFKAGAAGVSDVTRSLQGRK
jgi:hypothetical protein